MNSSLTPIARPARRLAGLVLSLATLALTACGAPMAPVAPSGDLEAAGTASALRVAFNDAYAERNAINVEKGKQSGRNPVHGLRGLIQTARVSLDGAFYDIEDPTVVADLVAASKRGVRVRIVTDSDNMVDQPGDTRLREAIRKLRAGGVPVVEDERSGIMHHKFLVVDGRTVWMGSTNLTTSSLYKHNNNSLTLRSERLSDGFTYEFEQLFVERNFNRSADQVGASGVEVRVGGARVRAFFSPNGGGRKAVLAELQKAKKRIRMLTFSLTDPETGEVILKRAKAGVKVEGVFDTWLAAGEYSLFDTFKRAGLDVARDGNQALMHHKVIVIDDRTLITGSYNYSLNAEASNNEAFLIVQNAPSLVKAYVQEYERVRYAADHNHPPAHDAPDDPEVGTGKGP